MGRRRYRGNRSVLHALTSGCDSGCAAAAAGSPCAWGVWLQQAPESWLYSWHSHSPCLKPGFVPGAQIPCDISGLFLHPCVYILPVLPDCLTACQGLLRISKETQEVQSGITWPSSSLCFCMLNRAVIAVTEYKHLGLKKVLQKLLCSLWRSHPFWEIMANTSYPALKSISFFFPFSFQTLYSEHPLN